MSALSADGFPGTDCGPDRIRYICRVRRLFGIVLLTSYLFGTTEVEQLLKLPVLFEHYAEHRQENSNISFTDFLYMHYADTDHNDVDQDRDMQLPFKTNCSQLAHGLSPCFPPSTGLSLSASIADASTLYFARDVDVPSAYLSSIWQPPKQA